MNLDEIAMWMNEKISNLPNWLGWITKKLIDQIPIVELINGYDFEDLEKGNEEKIATDLNQKIDKMQLSLISSFVPGWTKFIIPVNILLLIIYIKF